MDQDLAQRLRDAGLKVTEQRKKIFEVLCSRLPHHMSAEEIYGVLQERHEDVGLATVYRVLAQLEEVSLVVRHRFANDYSVYELVSETHHDHLVCTKCGRVDEFCDNEIESKIDVVVRREGFVQESHQLTIYGVCADCINT